MAEGRPLLHPCVHEDAPRHAWSWLPQQDSQVMTRHAWCQHCGTVRYQGPRRAQDEGGLANRLSDLYLELEANGVVVADVQRRLILRRSVQDRSTAAGGQVIRVGHGCRIQKEGVL